MANAASLYRLDLCRWRAPPTHESDHHRKRVGMRRLEVCRRGSADGSRYTESGLPSCFRLRPASGSLTQTTGPKNNKNSPNLWSGAMVTITNDVCSVYKDRIHSLLGSRLKTISAYEASLLQGRISAKTDI